MSSRIETIRTTAFRLKDEDFGTVWVYRPGEEFARTWDGLEAELKSNPGEFRRLPYGGLAAALRVMTGDFVALERRAQSGRAFIVSRKLISAAQLQTAIGSWEARVLNKPRLPLSKLVRDLHPKEVRVGDLIERRRGLSPTMQERWVWDVGIWEMAHRLVERPMRTDSEPVRWRLDSDAALLSWDKLLHAPKKDDAAMHKLALHLITVPGVEDPVLSIQASLVRLAPNWRFAKGARYAWAELSSDTPLLRGRVKTQRRGDGDFLTSWADGAAEVLYGASLNPLPGLDQEPVPTGAVRTGFAKQPQKNPFGRGVGMWFHECVAHHMRDVLADDARAITLATRRVPAGHKNKATRLPLGLDNAATSVELRVAVVYANADQRRRVRDALARVLAQGAHERDRDALADLKSRLKDLDDNEDLLLGPFSVRFVRPDAADRYLLERSPQAEIEKWADGWLTSLSEDGIRVAAIIETDLAAKDDVRKKDGLADPKPALRRFFASRGAATQFITSGSAPNAKKGASGEADDEFREYAASNAIGDLLRSAGFFLRPFPEFGCDDDTLAVGIYGARLTSKTTGRRASYVVNLVAVSLGSRDAWGFVDGRGWVPLDQATANFLASDQTMNSDIEAKALVERAVNALNGRFGDRKAVLLFDALGCRRFWKCLADQSDARLEAWMTGENRAVVRVRTATSEVLRPAGTGEWSSSLRPATHTPFRLMAVEGAEGVAPTCVLAGSAVMSNEWSARGSTRFAAKPNALKKDWHALGVTELQVLDPGPFEREALLQQIGILCRIAPTWDRTLRWPSPLHLARAVVRDHPHGYFDEDEQAEEVEDAKQMRFDF